MAQSARAAAVNQEVGSLAATGNLFLSLARVRAINFAASANHATLLKRLGGVKIDIKPNASPTRTMANRFH